VWVDRLGFVRARAFVCCAGGGSNAYPPAWMRKATFSCTSQKRPVERKYGAPSTRINLSVS